MSSNSVHSIEISEEILNGIHPNTTEAVDKKNCNERRGQNKYFGIPEDILDGIHPKIQHQSNDKYMKT